MVAAVLISVNWGMFIYGVNSGQVVEVSLGYFINPLVTVLAGVLVLGERLRRTQWAALAIAAAAVAGLTVAVGPPAVDRADPGVLVRRLRPGPQEGRRRGGRGAHRRDPARRTARARATSGWLGAAGQAQSLEELAVAPGAAGHQRAGDRAAADLLRRGRDPGAADHARAAAVRHPDPALRHRGLRLRRGDADGPVARPSPRSGSPWRCSPSTRCATVSASSPGCGSRPPPPEGPKSVHKNVQFPRHADVRGN